MPNNLVTKLQLWWRQWLCVWCVAWHSVAVTAFGGDDKQRQFDRHAHAGARKLLEIVNAKYKISCEEKFHIKPNTAYILMSNHQSLFDLPLIFTAIPGSIRVLIKEELLKVPLFGNALAKTKNIAINRTNPHSAGSNLFMSAKQILNEGIALLIFPEGTRSKDGKILPFKAGGFRLARETGATIIPVGIIGTRKILPVGTLKPTQDQELILRIGKPIDTKAYPTMESQKTLMDKVRTEICRLADISSAYCEQ